MAFLELSYVRHCRHRQRILGGCMKGRRNQGADFELKEVVLIEYITPSLDVAQVSRHLALMSAVNAAGTCVLADNKPCSPSNRRPSLPSTIFSDAIAARDVHYTYAG